MSKGFSGIIRLTIFSMKCGVVLGAGWLVLALALPVLGDAAPPEQPPGSNLDPGQATQVRMLAELPPDR